MGVPEDELIHRIRRGYDPPTAATTKQRLSGSPEVVFVSPGSITELRGAEALRAWMEPDAFESQVSHPGEIEIAGNKAHEEDEARRTLLAD